MRLFLYGLDASQGKSHAQVIYSLVLSFIITFLGLVSHNGEHCFSACSWTDAKTGKVYDFSALSGTHVVEGSRLFTASGTQYYHQVGTT